MNGDLDLFGFEEIEQFGRVLFQVFPCCNVAIDNGSHQLDVFGSQSKNVDGVNRTRLFSLVLKLGSSRFEVNLLHCHMRSSDP